MNHNSSKVLNSFRICLKGLVFFSTQLMILKVPIISSFTKPTMLNEVAALEILQDHSVYYKVR